MKMKSDQVVFAAKLISQLEKLESFLDEAPQDADTLTITFRKGKYSKSLSLNDKNTIVDLRETVKNIYTQTIARVVEMGVEVDDTK